MSRMIEKRLPYNVYLSGPRKGQCKTLTDRIVRYIVVGLNGKEIESRTKKRTFEINGKLYFIGTSGSVRTGKNVSNSVDIAGLFKQNMTKWEKENEL